MPVTLLLILTMWYHLYIVPLHHQKTVQAPELASFFLRSPHPTQLPLWMHFSRAYSLFLRLCPLPGESFHISPLGELLNSQGPLRRRPLLSKGLPWWPPGRLSHPLPAFPLAGVLTSKEAPFPLYISHGEIYSISNDIQHCIYIIHIWHIWYIALHHQ